MKRFAFVAAMLLAAGAWAQGNDWTFTRDPAVTSRPSTVTARNTEDFCLMNSDITPLSLGLFAPVQLPWGNWSVRGLRLSVPYGRCDTLTGLDVGVWNRVDRDMAGLQLGAVGTSGTVHGLQLGVVNTAVLLKGVQIGLINYAEGARGLQIGLVNVIADTDWGFFPIVFWSF